MKHGAKWFYRYVSSDFGNHPLSHLMGSVFGMHNKENIEVLLAKSWLTNELPCADAVSKGVRPDQIIFTDVAMKNEHIRRSALADLFLDT
ncbi:hypothetical protein B296_00003820 [Ensete ventricosum]|uniref:O-GlcNAc transferase C-terminal domain-containing protein n=1 Tax=Ensete ventricosum TaxID=4639 RepID=A0A426ZT43_ENSVE|nr:hypothetical protein B296_00003820 [Ensete ventricosum]